MLHSLLNTWNLATMTCRRSSEEEIQIQYLSQCFLKSFFPTAGIIQVSTLELLGLLMYTVENLKMNNAKHPECFKHIPDESMQHEQGLYNFSILRISISIIPQRPLCGPRENRFPKGVHSTSYKANELSRLKSS